MTKKQVDKLTQAFRTEFRGDAEAERISPGRFRFAIVSPRFDRMPHLKRQDLIWKVVERELPRDASLDISIILAYSAKDMAEMK